MHLMNATSMVAGFTLGRDAQGRESLVVVVKGTFNIPYDGSEPGLLVNQVPLIMADTFTGEPGASAPVYEVDFAPRKRRCDVLLVGSAHSPEGQPAQRVRIGVKVGSMVKTFVVTGDRVWERGVSGFRPSEPERFVTMPITYDRAFGGVERGRDDPQRHDWYRRNPIGRGYHTYGRGAVGAPLPNTEEVDRPMATPAGDYVPMALGPLGRNWEPRCLYVGTYDQAWLDDVFPFLPADFDETYYQAAPTDQQIGYPVGGEEVVLINVSPSLNAVRFTLPRLAVPVVFFLKRGGREERQAVVDTIVLEPDLDRLTLTWRTCRELKRDVFEVAAVLVGEMPRAWWRARDLGKEYFPSLAALSRAQQQDSSKLQ